jgi:hypothetical protein
MSFGLFSTLLTTLVSLGHIYLYRRVLAATGAPGWLKRAGIVALVLLGPGFVVVRQLFSPLPFPWGGWLSAAQWSWIVFALYWMAVLGGVDLVLRALRRRSTQPVSPEVPATRI